MVYFYWVDVNGVKTDLNASNFFLGSYDLGGIPAEYITSKLGSQDGSTVLDTRLNDLRVSLSYNIESESLLAGDQLRSALKAAFDPKKGRGYLFMVLDNSTEYWLGCRIETGYPKFPPGKETNLQWQKMDLALVAHDPLWNGITEIVPLIPETTSWIPWLGTTDPSGGEWVISGIGDTVTVNNGGDQNIPVILTIYGGTGSITDCRITNNNTGEFIEIVGLIDSGESFIIDTDENVLSAAFFNSAGVESRGCPMLSLDTVFWYLMPGDNEIAISASAQVAGNYTTLKKTVKYAGR